VGGEVDGNHIAAQKGRFEARGITGAAHRGPIIADEKGEGKGMCRIRQKQSPASQQQYTLHNSMDIQTARWNPLKPPGR
jgi:hypothetical protein